MTILGIDLGTTNTVAAIAGRALTLRREGGAVLPSVVAFPPNGVRQVGSQARRRRPIDLPAPERVGLPDEPELVEVKA